MKESFSDNTPEVHLRTDISLALQKHAFDVGLLHMGDMLDTPTVTVLAGTLSKNIADEPEPSIEVWTISDFRADTTNHLILLKSKGEVKTRIAVPSDEKVFVIDEDIPLDENNIRTFMHFVNEAQWDKNLAQEIENKSANRTA